MNTEKNSSLILLVELNFEVYRILEAAVIRSCLDLSHNSVRHRQNSFLESWIMVNEQITPMSIRLQSCVD